MANPMERLEEILERLEGIDENIIQLSEQLSDLYEDMPKKCDDCDCSHCCTKTKDYGWDNEECEEDCDEDSCTCDHLTKQDDEWEDEEDEEVDEDDDWDDWEDDTDQRRKGHK